MRVHSDQVRGQNKTSQLYMDYILHIPMRMLVSNPNREDYKGSHAQTHGRFFFAQLKRGAFLLVELYIHNLAM
tara:strand:+ start:146 stop:364 length:219 start_codon:yes stop_codon:yes gene_type:complete